MQSKYNFDKAYLDANYLKLLELYCLKKKFTNLDFYDRQLRQDDIDSIIDKQPLTGIKKLFIIMSLFDKIDSISSEFNLGRLIHYDIIDYDSHIFGRESLRNAYSNDFCISSTLMALKLMEIHKKDVIRYVKNKYKNTSLYCFSLDNKRLSFDQDYSEIIINCLDLLNHNRNDIDLEILNYNFTLDLHSLIITLKSGIYYSQNEDFTFINSIFTNMAPFDLLQNYDIYGKIDLMYKIVKTQLPNEINILPMPQSFDDVMKIRKSPYLKSFKNILNEWFFYIETGEINLSEKIKKDVIKANQYLDRLEKYKKYKKSPYYIIFELTVGLIPILSTVLTISSFAGSFIEDNIQNKNQWILP